MSTKKTVDNSNNNNLNMDDLRDVLLKKAKRNYKPLFNEIFKSRFHPFKNYIEAEEYIDNIVNKHEDNSSTLNFEDKKYKPIHY